MSGATIALGNGRLITGRLVEHLGQGRVIIDIDGRRYAGRAVRHLPEPVAR